MVFYNFSKFSNWCRIDTSTKHRVIYRESLTLQENQHKAHQISRNFGLAVLDISTQTFPTFNYLAQLNFFFFFSQRGTIKKKKISIRNRKLKKKKKGHRKLIQISLKLDVSNFNFHAHFESKDGGARFVDLWNNQNSSRSLRCSPPKQKSLQQLLQGRKVNTKQPYLSPGEGQVSVPETTSLLTFSQYICKTEKWRNRWG